MIADRRSGELWKGNKNERSPLGFALPGVSGAAPTTTPERLSELHGLRCLIAANFSGRDQSGKQLDALAEMQGRHAAGQIFKSDVRKTLCTHHLCEPRLVREA